MRLSRSLLITSLALLLALAACQPAPTAEPAATVTPAPAPSATPSPPAAHIIGVRQVEGVGEFYDTRNGETFIPRGVNYVFVPHGEGYATETLKEGVYDPARTRQDFARLAGLGYNTVRVFLDHCHTGTGCLTLADKPGLNPVYLGNIADMTRAAQENGLLILFTSNDLPDGGGYGSLANQGANEQFAGYRNSYYLRPQAVTATRNYWGDLLSGLSRQGAAFETVLGWELLNEQWMFRDQPPLSLTSGTVETTTGSYDMGDPAQKEIMVSEGLVYYIEQVREEIVQHDPTALVAMGFFVPELVAPDWYVETASLLHSAPLDFFDFHAYPGPLDMQTHAEAFGMPGYRAKPVILGEYGAFRSIYPDITSAASAINRWAAASCEVGFDGWLYWSYYPANATANDQTWGLTDEDGYLLDLFSPQHQPDICTPLQLPNQNVALGKPVSASSALAEEPAANAVDDNPATQWGAGADAPQWIEIDLEGVYTLNEVRLLVAQWPEGATIHRLQVRGGSGEAYTTVYEFSGPTADGDWLVFTPETPLSGVSQLRIQTVASPSWVSWKEIVVLGDPGE